MHEGNQPGRKRRRWITVALVFCVALLFWRMRPPRPAPAAGFVAHPAVQRTDSVEAADSKSAESAAPVANAADVPTPAADVARLLGTWQDEFYGQRTMTFRDDGTGTMHLHLDDPVSRVLYGSKLTFFFSWTLEEDVLHLAMTGGEPKAATETLSQLFGKSSDRRIEHLDEHELQMRSLDSQKLYVHRRE